MKKTLLAFLVVALAAIPAQAQLFRPSVVQGAVLGGVAGAVIGHNSGRHGGEGAAIGAVAGALVGAAFDQHESRPVIVAPAPVVYAPQPVYCAPQPVYCPPPPPAQVVYVQPAPVCPPPSRVVVYRYQPTPVIVYQSYGYRGYAGYDCRPPVIYGHGGRGYSARDRWR